MHQRKSKKILIYFFLLILLGSVNNISFNKLKFEDIKKINISGLRDEEKKNLLIDINNLKLENIFFLNGSNIVRLLENNSLIESYTIFKKYPSTIDINIEKTIFLAKINISGQEFLIGSNGKLTKNNFSTEYLPYIFGKPEINEFLKFKKVIDKAKISYDEIKSFYYFKSKRWDIQLKNNIIIKLSKENTKKSLNDALIFLSNSKFKEIEILDARIINQMILHD